jgi:hypothetical protein
MAEISEARLDKIAARAAKKVQDEASARSKILDQGEEEVFDLTADQDLDAFNDAPPDEGEAAVAYDIFDDMEGRVKKGHQIQYMLKRNGEMICVLYHPYSWEQIQRKYKGGQYQVIAKSLTTKRYIKSETRMLADPTGGAEGSGEASPQFSQAQIQAQIEAQVKAHTPQQQAPSFMEIFSVMNSMSEKSKQAEKEAAAASSNSTTRFMQAFMQMSQSQAQATQQMMLEIAKMTQTMSEKMSLTTQTMFEKMESRFEKIVDKITSQPKKEDGIGMLELLKLQQDSQDKGFKFATQLTQIAEAKAQEKVELIEEMEERFGGKGSGEKKSMTDTLIETMLPTISNALLQSKGAAQAAPQIPQQQRRALPRAANPNQGQRVARQNTALARSGNPQNQNQGNRQAQAQGSPQASKGGGAAHGQNAQATQSVVSDKFGLGSIAIAPEPVKVPSPEIDHEFDQTHFEGPTVDQDFIIAELAPVIGESLMNAVDPKTAAEACIEKLKVNNIGVKKLLELLSYDDMMKLVATYNLPPEANPWFSEVYGAFKTGQE